MSGVPIKPYRIIMIYDDYNILSGIMIMISFHYRGDEILPSYMGIIRNHDIMILRIPSLTNPGFNGK